MGKFKIAVLWLMACACQAEILLTTANTVNLRGEINEFSVLRTQEALAKLEAARGSKDYPIYLVIDSGGGSIHDGLSFIEFAKTIKNLHTINLFAASMASAIQQALPGKRIGLANSVSMFHRASGGFQGQFSDGEVESRLKFSKDMVALLETANASRLQMSLADYKVKIVNELWIVGADNLTQHALDEIDTIKCETSLMDKAEVSGNTIFSGCPLFRTGKEIITNKVSKKQ